MKQKKKKKLKDEEDFNLLKDVVEESQIDNIAESFESNVETSFFYTNDKFINKLDEEDIFNAIEKKYPLMSLKFEDAVIKKQIFFLFNDDEFIQILLKHFNLTFLEFFSIIYQKYSSLFKGPFIKKLKKHFAGKDYYINARKRHDY